MKVWIYGSKEERAKPFNAKLVEVKIDKGRITIAKTAEGKAIISIRGPLVTELRSQDVVFKDLLLADSRFPDP